MAGASLPIKKHFTAFEEEKRWQERKDKDKRKRGGIKRVNDGKENWVHGTERLIERMGYVSVNLNG